MSAGLGIVLQKRHFPLHSTNCFQYAIGLHWKWLVLWLSLNSLDGPLRRLQQDKDTLYEYDPVIKTQIQQGIVEIVKHSEQTAAETVHYLPHHAVIRRDKDTTK